MRNRFFVPTCRVAIICLFTIVSSGIVSPSRADHLESGSYQFGVFPHFSAGQIENMFAPIAVDLSKALGRPVALKTKSSYAAFTTELDRETYDIAFIQPFDYIRAHDLHGYIPLARRGERLAALIAVKADSPLETLADLKGKKLGLPPEVAAVSHLTKMALLQAHIDPRTDLKIQYYKAHDSCLQQVLIGEIAACGTAAYPIRFFENKWHVKFRVLAKSQSISHSLFVVHPRVPKSDREIILKTLLSLPNTDAGRKLLEKGELKPFIAVTDAEYDSVRAYSRTMLKK